LKIAGMVVWALTAGIGIYVLAVGIAAGRRVTDLAVAAVTAAPLAGPARPGGPAPAAAAAAVLPDDEDDGSGAVLTGLAALAENPPGPPHDVPPEGSPLLEFVHPALALLGLTFWIFFVMTGDRAFAWVAFGVVVATVAAGLSWELVNRRIARRHAAAADGSAGTGGFAGTGPGGLSFPGHLIVLHGVAAAATLALVVIAAVAAS